MKTKGRKKQFGSFCELADRRDLWRLLERLGEGVTGRLGCSRRLQFLIWACQQVKGPGGKPVMVDRRSVGLTQEVYTDLTALAGQFGLDLEEAAKELERRVRRLK